jgi:hypothetical protein
MGEAKVVSIEELSEGNPTMCLSALRVFNKCFECPAFIRAEKLDRLDRMKCTPHIDRELLNTKLLEEKAGLEKQIQKIDEEIKAKTDLARKYDRQGKGGSHQILQGKA